MPATSELSLRVSVEDLRRFCVTALEKVGVSPVDAETTADVLVTTDTWGLPMGSHKGYGIALLIESLSAILTGALMTGQVSAWMGSDPTQPTGHGAAFVAIDIDAMQPIAQFKNRVDALVEEIHSAPRAEGVERLYVPGEMEWERRRHALVEGILLPPDVVASVTTLAKDLDVALPKSLSS